jgi:hypothetical protein
MRAAIAEVTGRPSRGAIALRHTRPASFTPGQAVALEISADRGNSMRLHYRHVTHAERWRSMEMEGATGKFHGAIPAGYTATPYPLQYYFECKDGQDKAWLYPGFAADLANQPYFVVRSKG